MSAQPNEAKQEDKKPMPWHGISTDLSTFKTWCSIELSKGGEAIVELEFHHGMDEEVFFADFQKFHRSIDKIANDGDYVRFWNGARKEANAANPTSKEAQAGQPASTGNGNGQKTEGFTFSPGKVIVKFMSDDPTEEAKPYYEVTGAEKGKFPQYPMRIWGEVLAAAGITEDDVDPKTGYSLLGWTAVYKKKINKEGKEIPDKVIELRRPDFV